MSLMSLEQHYNRAADAFANALVVGYGVDWNRVTVDANLLQYKRDGVGMLRGVRDLAGDSGRGNKPKSFSNSGYSGLALGAATIGYRKDSAWVELRSNGADRLWDFDWYDYSHCTRIDLRVDVVVVGDFELLGESLVKGYEYLASTYKRNGGWKIPSYVRRGKGETVYVGSRESSHFCRVYNKTVEGGYKSDLGDVWRFEWQFNNPLANEVSHGLRRRAERERVAFDTVMEYNKDNGLPTSFGFTPVFLGRFTAPRVDTDNQRSHEWLRRTVAPTVRRLTREGEYAKLEQSLGLLGLDIRQESELF